MMYGALAITDVVGGLKDMPEGVSETGDTARLFPNAREDLCIVVRGGSGSVSAGTARDCEV